MALLHFATLVNDLVQTLNWFSATFQFESTFPTGKFRFWLQSDITRKKFTPNNPQDK